MSKERKNCLCTAMLYDPATAKQAEPEVAKHEGIWKVAEKLSNLKQNKFLKRLKGLDRSRSRKLKMFLFNLLHL
jgi:hypothetical protein